MTQPHFGELRADLIYTERWTTWGALTKLPPPWNADCHRCRQRIGTYDEQDVMSDAILAHVARCTRRRAFWRRLTHRRR